MRKSGPRGWPQMVSYRLVPVPGSSDHWTSIPPHQFPNLRATWPGRKRLATEGLSYCLEYQNEFHLLHKIPTLLFERIFKSNSHYRENLGKNKEENKKLLLIHFSKITVINILVYNFYVLWEGVWVWVCVYIHKYLFFFPKWSSFCHFLFISHKKTVLHMQQDCPWELWSKG